MLNKILPMALCLGIMGASPSIASFSYEGVDQSKPHCNLYSADALVLEDAACYRKWVQKSGYESIVPKKFKEIMYKQNGINLGYLAKKYNRPISSLGLMAKKLKEHGGWSEENFVSVTTLVNRMLLEECDSAEQMDAVISEHKRIFPAKFHVPN